MQCVSVCVCVWLRQQYAELLCWPRPGALEDALAWARDHFAVSVFHVKPPTPSTGTLNCLACSALRIL